jgi:HSP20 family molecular chaperone IbpA
MAFGRFGESEGFDEWSQKIREIMDEMQKRDFVRFRGSGTWQPATNVYETREAYYICVELSGVSPEQVDVECAERSRVLISGGRPQPRPDGVSSPLSIHALEIDEGRFRREIDLPEEVDVERIDAKYDKGFLWITIPRTTAP